MKSCITISLVDEARGGPFVFWDGLEDGCRRAAELGFDAVEVFPPGPEAIDVADFKRQLDACGLRLAAVGTGAGWVKHRLTLTAADPDQRQSAIAFVQSIIDLAGEFGGSAIIGSMQGRFEGPMSRQQALDHLKSSFDQLGPAAARHGVPLFYEPLNRYETNLCNTLADGSALLDDLATDNILLLADLFHMNIEEAGLGAALEAAADRVGHIHFVDSNRRPVGSGHLDMTTVIDALHAISYNGYLSAEALPFPDSISAAEMTMRAFRHWTSSPE